MDTQKIFVFVVASFEHPTALEFIKMRKALFLKYTIPNMFLYDGQKPEDFVSDVNDVFYEKPIPSPTQFNPALNPHMILKFMKAIRTIDLSKYSFIVRINLTTYINFPKLFEYLNTLLTEKTVAAHTMSFLLPDSECYQTVPIQLLSGTCMIFTTDFVSYLQGYDLEHKTIYMYNDDVVLSHLAKEFQCTFKNIDMYLWEYGGPSENLKNYILIRCKDNHDKMRDIEKWRYLSNM